MRRVWFGVAFAAASYGLTRLLARLQRKERAAALTRDLQAWEGEGGRPVS